LAPCLGCAPPSAPPGCCTPGGLPAGQRTSSGIMAVDTCKIFVGGLPQACDENGLMAHFQAYGNITEVLLKRDQATGQSRGFGFVNFDSVEAVYAAMSTQHVIEGKAVEIKQAQAKGSAAGGAPKGASKGAPKGMPPLASLPSLGQMPGTQYHSFHDFQSGKPSQGGKDYGGKSWKGGDSGKGQPAKGCNGGKAPAPQMSKGWAPSPGPMSYGGGPASYGSASPYGAKGQSAPSWGGSSAWNGGKGSWDGGGGKGWSGGKAWDAGKGMDFGKPSKGPAPKGPSPWDGGKGKSFAPSFEEAPAGKTFEQDDAKVFCGGIPKHVSSDEIAAYFEQFGEVAKVDLKLDLAGASRGFGFVTFHDVAAADGALSLYNQHQIGGKWVEVKSAMANGQPAPGQKGGGGGKDMKGAPPARWAPY